MKRKEGLRCLSVCQFLRVVGFGGPANFTFCMLAGACEFDFFACGGLPKPGIQLCSSLQYSTRLFPTNDPLF